jgi:hypothetical protein
MDETTRVTITDHHGREVHTTVGDMERLARDMAREPLRRKPLKLIPATDDVREVAAKVIRECHPHLLDCHIAHLYRLEGEDWYKGRHIIGAQVRLVNELTNAVMLAEIGLAGQVDAALIVNQYVWDNRLKTMDQREALLDHEFSHLKKDEDNKGFVRWWIDDHDLQEFVDVARRRGKWDYALQEMVDALDEYEQSNLPGVERA